MRKRRSEPFRTPDKEGDAPLNPTHVKSDAIARERYVERLWYNGVPEHRILIDAQAKFSIAESSARVILAHVRERCINDHEQNRTEWKHQTIERVLGHIDAAKNQRARVECPECGKSFIAVKPQWSAIASLEKHLADIQGTKAPAQVNVMIQFDIAIVRVVSNLTADQKQDMLREYNNVMAKAAKYDELMSKKQ